MPEADVWDIKAEIDVQYILEANGTISHVEYLTKNVPEAFQKSIVNALVKWKSEPPTIKETPTRIKLLQRMIFTIPE